MRAPLVDRLAAEIAALRGDPYVRVGIDGVDGAGKTVFADELAAALRARGRAVVRASVDGFHRPRALRYARGRESPEGFYRDSYDLAALLRELLDPLGPGGDGVHRTRVFDVATDTSDPAPAARAAPGSVLVLDGIFLHRPELRERWSWSLWLEVERATSLRRCAERDGRGSPDPAAPANRRYVEGQRLYLAEAAPRQHATRVVDNDDLAAPVLLR
ncbi:uridine kinase [Kineococcus glutinatus]|uniref:Uridine kinase n=1 Tax=Kineococcus glutinatus TaxID=1070872 RepID=A0ABP9I493_9ACTN